MVVSFMFALGATGKIRTWDPVCFGQFYSINIMKFLISRIPYLRWENELKMILTDNT